MQNITPITSNTNPIVKHLKQLNLAKFRKQEGLFLIEGRKLYFEAKNNGIKFHTVFAEQSFLDTLGEHDLDSSTFLVPDSVIKSISDISTPQDVVAAGHIPEFLPDFQADGLYVLLDGVQDPSNVGAIIRCADAMGAKAVLLINGCADAYSPKAIRGAMGSTFHLPVYACEWELILENCKDFDIIAGDLSGTDLLPDTLKAKTLLVIGSEGKGISQPILEHCNIKFKLAMKGLAESLNAAVAAGIMMYEICKR